MVEGNLLHDIAMHIVCSTKMGSGVRMMGSSMPRPPVPAIVQFSLELAWLDHIVDLEDHAHHLRREHKLLLLAD